MNSTSAINCRGISIRFDSLTRTRRDESPNYKRKRIIAQNDDTLDPVLRELTNNHRIFPLLKGLLRRHSHFNSLQDCNAGKSV